MRCSVWLCCYSNTDTCMAMHGNLWQCSYSNARQLVRRKATCIAMCGCVVNPILANLYAILHGSVWLCCYSNAKQLVGQLVWQLTMHGSVWLRCYTQCLTTYKYKATCMAMCGCVVTPLQTTCTAMHGSTTCNATCVAIRGNVWLCFYTQCSTTCNATCMAMRGCVWLYCYTQCSTTEQICFQVGGQIQPGATE